MWNKYNGVYVCVPYKCGRTSYLNSVGKNLPTMGSVEAKQGTKYLAIRHPVDRFTSLWRFVQDHPFADAHDNPLKPLAGLSTDELMDYIETHDNPHWRPQASYWHYGVTGVPFERLLEHIGAEPRHNNKSKHAAPERVPEDRIKAYYFEDLVLYQQAKKSPVPVGRG